MLNCFHFYTNIAKKLLFPSSFGSLGNRFKALFARNIQNITLFLHLSFQTHPVISQIQHSETESKEEIGKSLLIQWLFKANRKPVCIRRRENTYSRLLLDI